MSLCYFLAPEFLTQIVLEVQTAAPILPTQEKNETILCYKPNHYTHFPTDLSYLGSSLLVLFI